MPYWRLSGFYFFYFASLGALIFYWSVYLESLGLSRQASGELIAILSATKIISPLIWGWMADHIGHRMRIVRFGAFAAVLTFASVYWVTSYWPLAAAMMAFSFFWNAVLPQFEATTFSYLGQQTHGYSKIRLWGSIGFIVAAWMVGWSIDELGVAVLPTIVLLLFAGIWLSSLAVPEQATGFLSLDHEPLLQVLKRPHVVGLLLVCFLMQASHGPYYVFFAPYMKSNGYSISFVGALIALSVMAEVVVFLTLHRWIRRFELRTLLAASLLLATLRWLLLALFPQQLSLVLFAQILHAATFGVYHVAAIQLIHLFFTGRHQGKGQALYSSVSFGAGGAIGSLYAGFVWDNINAATMFLIAAVLGIIGAVVAWRFVGHHPVAD